MAESVKAHVKLRMSGSTSAGTVLALVQGLQASAELVSMTPNPDDSIEITIETPRDGANFLEQLPGIVSARLVDDDTVGAPTYEITLEDSVAGC